MKRKAPLSAPGSAVASPGEPPQKKLKKKKKPEANAAENLKPESAAVATPSAATPSPTPKKKTKTKKRTAPTAAKPALAAAAAAAGVGWDPPDVPLSAPAATSSPSTPVAAAVPATPTAAAAAPVPVNYLREAAAGAKALRAPCDVSSLLTVLLQAHIPGLHHAKLSKKLTFAVGYLSKPYLEQGKAVKEQQFTLHDVPVKVVPRAMPEGGNMMICFFAQKVIRNYVTKEFARLGVVTAGCNPYTLFLHFDTVENMEKAVQLRFITLLGAKVRLLPCKVGGALIEK
eukprot:EG_transcript_17395